MSGKAGGVVASIAARLKKAWNDYLRKLAKANRQAFGGGKPDCCGPRGASTKPKSR
jgi:hypothetical protein